MLTSIIMQNAKLLCANEYKYNAIVIVSVAIGTKQVHHIIFIFI